MCFKTRRTSIRDYTVFVNMFFKLNLFPSSSVKIRGRRGHCPPSQFRRPSFSGKLKLEKRKKSDNVDVSLSSSISGFGLVGQVRKSETYIKDRLSLFHLVQQCIFVQQLKLYAFTFEFLLLYALFSLFELFVVLISCCELYATWYQKFVTKAKLF